jgi:hypothetical protein
MRPAGREAATVAAALAAELMSAIDRDSALIN